MVAKGVGWVKRSGTHRVGRLAVAKGETRFPLRRRGTQGDSRLAVRTKRSGTHHVVRLVVAEGEGRLPLRRRGIQGDSRLLRLASAVPLTNLPRSRTSAPAQRTKKFSWPSQGARLQRRPPQRASGGNKRGRQARRLPPSDLTQPGATGSRLGSLASRQ